MVAAADVGEEEEAVGAEGHGEGHAGVMEQVVMGLKEVMVEFINRVNDLFRCRRLCKACGRGRTGG